MSAALSNISVLRRLTFFGLTIASLSFASPVMADAYNGWAIYSDPPCAGVETPANSSAWQYIQNIRAHPMPLPSNLEVITHIKPTLETAAAAFDSWSLYTLGIFVYQTQATVYSKTQEEVAQNHVLAVAALEKAVQAGNCEAVMDASRTELNKIIGLLNQAKSLSTSGDNAGAKAALDAARSAQAKATELQRKARDLGLAAGGGAPLILQNAANSEDRYLGQIAAAERQLDESDRATQEAAQHQRNQQAKAAADAKQEQEEVERYKDAVKVRSKSPPNATIIFIYRSAVAGLPRAFLKQYSGEGMPSFMPAFGALMGAFAQGDYSFGNDDVVTISKAAWYYDAYIVYLNVRRHNDDTSKSVKLRITNQGGYWYGELLDEFE